MSPTRGSKLDPVDTSEALAHGSVAQTPAPSSALGWPISFVYGSWTVAAIVAIWFAVRIVRRK